LPGVQKPVATGVLLKQKASCSQTRLSYNQRLPSSIEETSLTALGFAGQRRAVTLNMTMIVEMQSSGEPYH
jgi:hypothetical protein